MTTIVLLVFILYPILISTRVNLTYLELVGRVRLTVYIFWKLKVVQFDIRTKGVFGVYVNGKEVDIAKLKEKKPSISLDDMKNIASVFGFKKIRLGFVYAEDDKMKATLGFAVIEYLTQNMLARLKNNGAIGEYKIYQKLSYDAGQDYLSIDGVVKIKLTKLVRVSIGTAKSYFKIKKQRKQSSNVAVS